MVQYLLMRSVARRLKFAFRVARRASLWLAGAAVLGTAGILAFGQYPTLGPLLLVGAGLATIFGVSGAVKKIRIKDQAKRQQAAHSTSSVAVTAEAPQL